MNTPDKVSFAEFIRSRIASFGYAFEGWWHVIRTQQNAWVHTAATIFAAGLGLYLQINRRDWALVILAVAMVWSAEFFNTALEAIVDLTSESVQHDLAKVSKDVGAAAVLIAAGAAALIGFLIFGPPLWVKITSWF
ncbi:MAG: diacylglycerol kinase family protein [Gammaproteobacteria bacterium]|nr:diacylglycerol kinase family protein [Gammaproteobacteria bacterium]